MRLASRRIEGSPSHGRCGRVRNIHRPTIQISLRYCSSSLPELQDESVADLGDPFSSEDDRTESSMIYVTSRTESTADVGQKA